MTGCGQAILELRSGWSKRPSSVYASGDARRRGHRPFLAADVQVARPPVGESTFADAAILPFRFAGFEIDAHKAGSARSINIITNADNTAVLRS